MPYAWQNGDTKHINVSFEEGKIHGLIGRNGSGKTMLMKCICGFIKPTSGEIIVDGKQVGKDVDFPKDMGIIIETPGFIPYYSGYKNLKLLAGLNNKIGKDEIRNSMKQVGLDPDLKRHVRKYSLGMRQRLGLRPANAEDTVVMGRDLVCSSKSTEDTAPVKLAFFCVPYPVTTTSFSVVLFSCMAISIVLLVSAGILTGL